MEKHDLGQSPLDYWPSPWPGEDAGPQRLQVSPSKKAIRISTEFSVHSRTAIASTMVVLRAPGEVFLLCHTGGDDAISWVEQIDPETLELIRRSPDLPGGPTWPGGLAAHANGSLYVVFGRHAHRLSSTLEVEVSRKLPRNRPYNSFVILEDGCLATKDFGGARPSEDPTFLSDDTEVLILDPLNLETRANLIIPEASVARLSGTARTVDVVGVTTLWRMHWKPVPGSERLEFDDSPSGSTQYRVNDGEGYGWDAVLADESAWFLNNGAGSEGFNGSLRGVGVATYPQEIVRVSRRDGAMQRYRVNDQPGGIVANPPAVDESRCIVVGYDSGNGVVTAWRYDENPTRLWTKHWNHAGHPLLFPESGIVVLGDFDQQRGIDVVLFVDIETGEELARVDTESPLQSVLFGAAGFANDIYMCTFTTVTRISFSV
jgi:hypothetical protein